MMVNKYKFATSIKQPLYFWDFV